MTTVLAFVKDDAVMQMSMTLSWHAPSCQLQLLTDAEMK